MAEEEAYVELLLLMPGRHGTLDCLCRGVGGPIVVTFELDIDEDMEDNDGCDCLSKNPDGAHPSNDTAPANIHKYRELLLFELCRCLQGEYPYKSRLTSCPNKPPSGTARFD